ncbi:serine protease [Kitasatospora sp. NPDC094015]|uniref:trypsin-like serine peptidase n=1 Tax=Kitasatospora sp. NPDC094015 TaxID=3155205 RepID=UPI00332506D7
MRHGRRPSPRRRTALRLLLPAVLLPAVLAGAGAPAARAVEPPPASPSAAGHPSTTSPAVPPPDTTAPAPAGPEADRVGALFVGGFGPGHHFCTAGVVPSPLGNLLLTAAHCVRSPEGVTFAPGYRDGVAPYGSWPVVRVFATEGWTGRRDPDQDFAFLQVAEDGAGRRIQSVVGANPIAVLTPFTGSVRLYGYGSRADYPLLCTNVTTRFALRQRRIHCPAYPGGTSGGPWVDTATGAVVGVIGGYQLGGDTPDISYSAYFDAVFARLYLDARFAASVAPGTLRPPLAGLPTGPHPNPRATAPYGSWAGGGRLR